MSLLSSLIPSLNGGSCADAGVEETRRPRFEVNETDSAYDLTVFLPGVAKEGLEITDEGGELRVTGKRTPHAADGRVTLHRETSDASFKLVLSHENSIDAEKIGAELKDGVLRLSLAKAESAKPRKIAVN
jgi:HSP20 family protein